MQEVPDKLETAVATPLEWATNNGVAFDHGKPEVALFRRERKQKEAIPKATIKAGNLNVAFGKQATHWLWIWLDSQLALKGVPRRKNEEGLECDDPSPPTYWADGSVAGQLYTGKPW